MTSKNPSNLTTTPVLQPRLPPADMEDQSFKTKDAKENISDINVRLFLSKKIDGLENLQIVDNVLTTKYVCMMSSDCDKNAQDGLKVKKRRIQLDNDNSDDDSDFFRPREQLQAELSLKKSCLTIYLANLRTQGCAKVLKNDFLCLIDGDHNGNLKDVKKENVVLLKLLKCLNRFGAKQHLPVCFHCNSLENAQVLIDSTTKTSVVDNNKQKMLLSCSHADVAESLWDEEMSNNENLANSNCKIILNDGKQHLATSYDGNNHGLIFANLARGATKGTCLTCKSIRCNHLKSWDIELKGKVINNQESAGEGSARDKEDHEVHKEYVFEEEPCEVTSKLKIKFPFDEIIQEKMRRADLSNYSHLSDLISHPSKTDTCKHGNSWSTKDPKSMGWIYSKTVRIAHSNYVPGRERTIYYRKTSGNCNCKHIYDGKDDQLQIVSNGKSDTRGSARAVSFVSISLLVDFLTEFLQNGTPMRGFFKSHQAKCINKYGMKEYSLICWKTWYDACVEFLGGVVTINEKECFTCVSCGPRPKALVVDGVQMGIQTSKLTEGEFTKVAKNSSKIEFKGSNYRDRMFIKLPANRNILREAAKKGAWPKYEKLVNPTKSAQDHDPGMELFWKLVSDLDHDQTAKPSRGLILLMSNLSTSSSTVGLMQTINTALIKDLMTFLQGGKSFLKGFEMIAVHKEMKTDYPVLMDILLNLCDTKGNISLPIRSFLASLVEHIVDCFNSAPAHDPANYIEREGGELSTQFYPNFPILRERAVYSKNCLAEDSSSTEDSCEKIFPTHSKLTPGLYLLTCACKFKVIYGFTMMLRGESPRNLFDFIMMRFEPEYNPEIIYDASCLVKEYGLNRELRRFMSIRITTDRFHEQNHKTCSDSFKTSKYPGLSSLNSEACEQTNSVLRKITSSTTYMSPQFYMRILSLFMANLNIIANNKK